MAHSRKPSKRSKRRSPKKSGKRSKRRSPKKSGKRSKRRSPKKSGKRSKRRSPKKTSDDNIIKRISNVVKKYISKTVPQDTLLSVIKNEYINLKNKGQLEHISEDIYDSLTQLYGDQIFSKMTEKQVDSYHSQIRRIVK